MRFRTFLEMTEEDTLASWAAELIYKNCQPFLRETAFTWPGKTGLYRGLLFDSDKPFDELTERPREPRDSTKEIHTLLDNYFAKKFGIKFRSKGVFCANNSADASGYGTPYRIFPIGKFDYLWSPLIEDAYNAFDQRMHGDSPLVLRSHPELFSMQHIWAHDDDEKVFKDYQDQLTDALESGTFDYRFNTGMQDALKHHSEIMISCRSYYIVNWETKASHEIMQLLSDKTK